MCNLYAMMRTRAEAATAAGAMRDRNNNQPPSPGIYPDYPAPIVLTARTASGRCATCAGACRAPSRPCSKLTSKRADKLRAKGTEFDFNELLKMEPDSGTTNVRNTTVRKRARPTRTGRPGSAPANRCLVPFTSFSEPDQDFGGTRKPIWFALGDDYPLAFFAGIWTPHACVRKMKTGWEEFEAFGFLTTESVEPVKTYHRKATPVILTDRGGDGTYGSATRPGTRSSICSGRPPRVC